MPVGYTEKRVAFRGYFAALPFDGDAVALTILLIWRGYVDHSIRLLNPPLSGLPHNTTANRTTADHRTLGHQKRWASDMLAGHAAVKMPRSSKRATIALRVLGPGMESALRPASFWKIFRAVRSSSYMSVCSRGM